MLKRLKKLTNAECSVNTYDLGDKFKHELFVNGIRVSFIWEIKSDSNFNNKDNTAIDAMVSNYLSDIDVAA